MVQSLWPLTPSVEKLSPNKVICHVKFSLIIENVIDLPNMYLYQLAVDL